MDSSSDSSSGSSIDHVQIHGDFVDSDPDEYGWSDIAGHIRRKKMLRRDFGGDTEILEFDPIVPRGRRARREERPGRSPPSRNDGRGTNSGKKASPRATDKGINPGSSSSEGNYADYQSDYVYDDVSGFYYNSSSGFYYDPCTGLYYSAALEKWLYYSSDSGSYYEPSTGLYYSGAMGKWYSYNEAKGAWEEM